MRRLCAIIIVLSAFAGRAQQSSTDSIGVGSKTDNIYNQPLPGDSLSSGFCIVIKKEVKAHKHLHHSEQVIVLEGEGQMRLGDKNFTVKRGDVVFIPKNTVHAVKSIGALPLKVISIQAPRFDGSDRVFVEDK